MLRGTQWTWGPWKGFGRSLTRCTWTSGTPSSKFFSKEGGEKNRSLALRPGAGAGGKSRSRSRSRRQPGSLWLTTSSASVPTPLRCETPTCFAKEQIVQLGCSWFAISFSITLFNLVKQTIVEETTQKNTEREQIVLSIVGFFLGGSHQSLKMFWFNLKKFSKKFTYCINNIARIANAGSLWMLSLLFSIVRNVISLTRVSRVTTKKPTK